MNRIKLGPLANVSLPSRTEPRPAQRTLERVEFGHVLFIPMHYEDKYSYPLVVWLHRGGCDERQLLSVMPQVSARNFVGVSIQAPDRHPDGDYQWLQSAEAIDSAQSRVKDAVDLASKRLNINRSRVIVAGEGSGGTMAFRLAFRQPRWFAGVASINGSLPCNFTPLSNWSACRHVPVFWAHGRASCSFPEKNLCHQLKLLHVAGFSVTLRQYPCSDDPLKQTFADLNAWIMEQMSKSGDHNIVK